jgi:hypothetical protein
MLCVKTLARGEAAADVICSAFRQVFVSEKTLKPESIPYRVMIADELPRNGNGKIDLYKIGRGEVKGETFTVETVKLLDCITDFRLVPYEEGPADMIQEVFDGISAEMKGNKPGSEIKADDTDQNGSEDNEMKTAKKALEAWNSLNRMGLQMMQSMFEQNRKMMAQVFDTVQKMTEPGAKDEETDASGKTATQAAPEKDAKPAAGEAPKAEQKEEAAGV